MSNKNAINKNRNGDNCFPYTFDFNVFTANYERLSDILAKIVYKTLTIAGISLSGNISASDLKNALINSSSKLCADLMQDGETNKVYTAIEKTKLNGIEAGAEVNDVNTVNGKTGDVVLSASDVGALPDSTVIPTVYNGTLTIQKNGVTIATFTANSSENVTANILADTQLQADWNQTDTEAVDYIKNKPTKLSDFSNDVGFITNIVNTLKNYYLKSETYTQAEVNALIGAIKTIKAEIVNSLPTADADTYFNTSKTIYLVAYTGSGNDYYNEYITVRTGTEGDYTYSWEKIGNTQIDLSNYVQKTTTIAGIDLQDNITKSELLTALNVADGAQVNTIESISAGGTALTPDVNKNVDIPIATPTKAGVGKINTNYGIHIADGTFATASANTADIDGRNDTARNPMRNYRPIVPSMFDYTLKKSITTNNETLTESEKTNAQTWLGLNTLTGSTAPTTSTVGRVGQIYIDTTNNKTYQCTTITGDGGDPEVFTYTWEQLVRSGELTEYGFKVINPPSSTTLSDDEIATIIKGCVINGTFMNLVNPTLLPARDYGQDYAGFIFGAGGEGVFTLYSIKKDTRVISMPWARSIGLTANVFKLYGLTHINRKQIPSYPTDLTKNYFLKQNKTSGTLSWEGYTELATEDYVDSLVGNIETLLSEV